MKLMPCPDCDYRVTQKGHLHRHIQAVHKGVKFPCEDCESTFTLIGNLQRHIKTVHKGVKFQFIKVLEFHVQIVNQHLQGKVTFRYTSNQFIKL